MNNRPLLRQSKLYHSINHPTAFQNLIIDYPIQLQFRHAGRHLLFPFSVVFCLPSKSLLYIYLILTLTQTPSTTESGYNSDPSMIVIGIGITMIAAAISIILAMTTSQ